MRKQTPKSRKAHIWALRDGFFTNEEVSEKKKFPKKKKFFFCFKIIFKSFLDDFEQFFFCFDFSYIFYMGVKKKCEKFLKAHIWALGTKRIRDQIFRSDPL